VCHLPYVRLRRATGAGVGARHYLPTKLEGTFDSVSKYEGELAGDAVFVRDRWYRCGTRDVVLRGMLFQDVCTNTPKEYFLI